MAENYIEYDRNSELGREAFEIMKMLKEGRQRLNNLVATMAEQKSSGVVGALIQSKAGCPTLAEAEALVSECEAFQFKLNTNDSQSNLDAAFDQFLARLGP